MRLADFQKYCLSLPGATGNVQWGNDHVFKVGGNMFAIVGIYDGKFHGLSFKATPESFHILTKEPGIVPAPYLAKAHWVALDKLTALPADQLRAYVARAHAQVLATLPKKTQAALMEAPSAAKAEIKKSPARRKGKAKA
jgi:predicted DNA-binding protein (MmcQ/YjbR family)